MNKKKFSPLLFLLCMIITTFYPGFMVKASVSDNTRIYDNAGLLTSKESEDITSQLDKVSQKYDCDVMIVTIDGMNGYNNRDSYIIDFAKQHKVSDDYVILLVDMDNSNRGLTISGNGACSKRVTDSLCDRIYNSIKADMSNQQYYKAFSRYTTLTDRYLSKFSRMYAVFTPSELLITFGVSLLIGFLIVFAMVRNAGGRDTTSASTYLNPLNSKVLVRRDQYIRTSIKKVPKPKENENHSGNSSGGGGGSSHSSGGGSF